MFTPEDSSLSDHLLSERATAGLYIYLGIMLTGMLVQLGLFFGALLSVARSPLKCRGRKPLFLLLSFSILVFYSASVSIAVWDAIILLAVDASTCSLERLGMSTAFAVLYILIGDCTMVWRCSAICKGRRLMSFVFCGLVLTSLSFGTLSVVNRITGKPSDLVGLLWVGFSATTNVFSSSVIVAKLLLARRLCIMANISHETPALYQDVIAIFVESAAPLALAGLCTVIVESIHLSGVQSESREDALYFLDLLANVLFLLFSALSPQMILFRSLVLAPKGSRRGNERSSSGSPIPGSVQFTTIQYFV